MPPERESGDGRDVSREQKGARNTLDRLLPLVYDELHAMAAARMRRERIGHTLQPTALVNEVYLKLARQEGALWENRAHLLAHAAHAIQQLLTDHARRRSAAKRGGESTKVALFEDAAKTDPWEIELLALAELLERLGAEDPVDRRIVELRFFGGLRVNEIAEVLDISERTVRRRWSFARAWLFRELGRGESSET